MSILSLTMHSYIKYIRIYALAVLKAGKLIPADIAGSLITKVIKSEYSITWINKNNQQTYHVEINFLFNLLLCSPTPDEQKGGLDQRNSKEGLWNYSLHLLSLKTEIAIFAGLGKLLPRGANSSSFLFLLLIITMWVLLLLRGVVIKFLF